jgi:hypothetical protein
MAWLVGVMVKPEGERAPLRHFFAVGQADQGKAEWSAVESALLIGDVASSPVKGLEPVHTISALTPLMVRSLALKATEVRSLGWRWPRRWTTVKG